MAVHREELEEGVLISPSLRLVRPLGAGGMGTVWIAHHLSLETDVVVKFISGEHASDSTVAARFRREAAAAASVKSPHVVHVLDYDITALGTPFIVMELLHGCDLRRHLEQHPVLPPREVVAIVRQVGRALSRAHEHGIVHRDVKPENVFLVHHDDDGEPFVKVLDFGIAKAMRLEEVTTTGTTVGTPYYMSPEQAVGAKTVDHRTDLWALGVMTFFMLTGRRPFQGATTGAVTLALHTGPIPRVTEANPALPKAIDAWFFRACARDLDKRFFSARELVRSLEAALLHDATNADVAADVTPDRVQLSEAATLRVRPDLVPEAATLTDPVASVEANAPTEMVASRRSLPPPKSSASTRVGAALVVLALVGAVVWLGTRQTTSAATPSAPPTPSPIASPTPSASSASLPTPPAPIPSAVPSPVASVVSAPAPKSVAPIAKIAPSPAPSPSAAPKPVSKPVAGDDLPDLK